MVDFIKKKETKPIVSRSVQGIENLDGIDSLFDDMKRGTQFGKLVIEIAKDDNESKV